MVRNGKTISVDVTLGERPALAATTPVREQDGDINAREAIAIATEAVNESGLLQESIDERVATPQERNGASVWVVELNAGSQVAVVVVDTTTGDVLELDVK